jgi:hypothetical protein
MNETQLRAMIRDAVARHLGGAAAADRERPVFRPAGPPASEARVPHVSQILYLTVVNADDACEIEPAVSCDHCGYCKSHGF